jgi:hypothetical protein
MPPGEKLLVRAFFEREIDERDRLLKQQVWPVVSLM